MTDSAGSTPLRPPREIRLAMVMNGGVSLAVWMGGLCRVLAGVINSAPDAQSFTELTPQPGDTHIELWRKLWQRTNLRLGLDVLAGTSAGGLNGIFLATSIGTGAPFPDLREVWTRAAGLARQQLLRAHDLPEPRVSILDGGFFEEEIRDRFAALVADGNEPHARDVECLVTATALSTARRRVSDDFASGDHSADRRRIFRFRRVEHAYTFNPPDESVDGGSVDGGSLDVDAMFTKAPMTDFDDWQTLARAARASSSYPIAFQPVAETASLAKHRHPPTQVADHPGRG